MSAMVEFFVWRGQVSGGKCPAFGRSCAARRLPHAVCECATAGSRRRRRRRRVWAYSGRRVR